MVKAWRFSPPVHKLDVFEKDRIDQLKTMANVIELNDKEKSKILSFPFEEVELP